MAADDPGGLRYATFRLADGVTFVHIAITEGKDNPCPGRPPSRSSSASSAADWSPTASGHNQDAHLSTLTGLPRLPGI